MSEDERWNEVWQTLVQTGLQVNEDGGATLTPSAYQPVDLSLPAPESPELTMDVIKLPILDIARRGEQHTADLRVIGVLGRGGMGEVLLANQQSLEREVAVKRLHNIDPRNIQALLREARIMGGLAHPNIVPVHALGRDLKGHPVLVMKRIEGSRWATSLAGPRNDARLCEHVLDGHLRILKDLCNAVDYAHSKGIIHRDIKPDNVLLGAYGEVMLADWGVAARTDEPAPEVALGTPSFMAPEMVHGDAPTAQTDVYLLGATLHRVLTGRPRHIAKTLEAAFLSAWRSKVFEYAPEVPAELAQIANKAMSRDPANRHPSAGAFRKDIESYETHLSSRHLTSSSLARLSTLQNALSRDDTDVVGTTELGSACRFGFRQALDAWPENNGAKSNLQKCLTLLVPWTLRNGTAHEAHALLDELETLVEDPLQYHALREQVDTALRRSNALEKLGRELDWSVGSKWRAGFLLFYAIASFVGGSTAVVVVRAGLVPLGHGVGIAGSALAAVSLSVLLALGGRKLMPNLASKRVLFTVVVAAWSIFFHRILAWSAGADVHYATVQDIVILMVCSAIAAVGIHLRLFVITFALALTAIAATALPDWSFEIATGSLALSGVLLTAVFVPWARR